MNYTIYTGENDRILISLDLNGNRYSVSAWDKVNHKTDSSTSAGTREDALVLFGMYKQMYNVQSVHRVEHDLSDFVNIN